MKYITVLILAALAGTSAAHAAAVQPELLKTIADDRVGMQERDAAIKSLAATREGGLTLVELARSGKLAD